MKTYYLIILIALFSTKTFPQIIYTDVVPDDSLALGQPYNLDLNNDGSTDFIFEIKSLPLYCSCGPSAYQHPLISPTAGNELLGGGSQSWVHRLNLNDSIYSQSQSWTSDSNQILRTTALFCFMTSCIPTWLAPWDGNTEGYVGLKIYATGNYFYGWARVYGGFIIKDYAYNSIPDSLILAGSIWVGINGIINGSIPLNIFPNPANKNSDISISGEFINAQIEIYNSFGVSVYADMIHQAPYIIKQKFISGIYFVKVIDGKNIYTNKLVVQ